MDKDRQVRTQTAALIAEIPAAIIWELCHISALFTCQQKQESSQGLEHDLRVASGPFAAVMIVLKADLLALG